MVGGEYRGEFGSGKTILILAIILKSHSCIAFSRMGEEDSLIMLVSDLGVGLVLMNRYLLAHFLILSDLIQLLVIFCIW